MQEFKQCVQWENSEYNYVRYETSSWFCSGVLLLDKIICEINLALSLSFFQLAFFWDDQYLGSEKDTSFFYVATDKNMPRSDGLH